jgi:hypothetical protein
MATLRLRYVHAFVDKTGRTRFYFRHHGKRWPLPGAPGSAEFAARYDELRQEHVVVRPVSNVAFGPNTLGSVIEKHLGSEEFKSKAPNTRRQYHRIITRLQEVRPRYPYCCYQFCGYSPRNTWRCGSGQIRQRIFGGCISSHGRMSRGRRR